ncbi:MAG: hypothetical protein ACOC2R_03355 [Spirochaetota bacterium]
MKRNKMSITRFAMKTPDLEAYIGVGGYQGLKKALEIGPQENCADAAEPAFRPAQSGPGHRRIRKPT